MSGRCLATSLALVVLLMGSVCRSQNILEIELDAKVSNGSLESYQDNSWFSHHYANLPSKISGFLVQPTPRNACTYIDLLNSTNETWFALVSDYPSCGKEMVKYVRNAGYKLIITSSSNDTHRQVPKSLRNVNFPIVVVKDHYAKYLEKNALSGSSDSVAMEITLDTSIPIMVITFSSLFFVTSCCIGWCCLCVCCCVCRRDDVIENRLQHLERQRRELEQQQRHDRLARQELIQSILRQLQELQIDIRQQTPLGQAQTEQLPKRQYQPGEDTCDTCAICVDDFTQEDVVRVLPCTHVFHPQCIDEWLNNHSSLCPLCKMELPRGQNEPQPQVRQDDSDDTSSTASESPLLPRRNRGDRSSLRPVYGSV